MNVHEYQAKQLLKSCGIGIPPGSVAASVAEAEAVARTLNGPTWAVKAQILAGARGPAGGVKLVHSVEEVGEIADLMLGAQLTTTQTAPEGQEIRRVYIEQGCEIVRSFYLALLLDTLSGHITILVSPERGAEGIEEVAAKHPERVHKINVDPDHGLQDTQVQELAAVVGLPSDQATTFTRYLHSLYETFISLDATLIELSPLIVADSGEMLTLDAKMSFDDNALFRHPTIAALQDRESIEPTELAAAQQGLNYIKLGGNIGTLVSGAGLAMATLDAIIEYGGTAANFFDVPPRARQAQIASAFKLLLADKRLSCILVNVFGGGIMRCDTLAAGIVSATQDSPLSLPLVVRLSGTDAEIGRKTLHAAGLDVTFADDLASAAAQAVQASQSSSKPQNASSSLLGSVKQAFSKRDR